MRFTFAPILMLLFFACQPKAIDFDALTEEERTLPENALASFDVHPELELQLFASEPIMSNPTNMNVDEKGRVWIIESLNYRMPYNPDNEYRPEGDRILILEDTNGDGKADSKKVYYQGEDINAALGIWNMGNKTYVSRSPHIFVFTDLDGDDKPDQKDTLFTNINGLQDDHGAHAMTFGPDGRLYFNFGNAGQQLFDKVGNAMLDQLGRPINTHDGYYRQGMVLRANPDGSNVEVLGHNFRNMFEVAVDSYGTLWQSDNDDDGNKAVRINYIMEHGNFGYKDEMDGSAWQSRRLGMNEDVPLKHWHLNDPGSVPNVLQTGSGSPTGILVYEGENLPAEFSGQMIHCEPGHQVVRSYPVTKTGAGYSAEIINLIKSKDPNFRPSDVCVAPDGSLLVADWYDGVVGGNLMLDQERGRIYRINFKSSNYDIPVFSGDELEVAVQQLKSPNLSTRYLGWTTLNESDEATEALKTLLQSEDDRLVARALWLLARKSGESENAIKFALSSENPDLRNCGIRIAKQLDSDHLLDYLETLADDPSAQVRREVALALRFDSSEKANQLWSTLANQHEVDDRWFLEALGIGADLFANARFDTWSKGLGESLSNAQKEIIWRMRADGALPYLAKFVKESDDSPAVQKYLRAFHFHKGPEKNPHLAPLLDLDEHPMKKEIAAWSLGLMDGDGLAGNSRVMAKVRNILPEIAGTDEWFDAVSALGLTDQQPELLDMFWNGEGGKAQQAGSLLVSLGGFDALRNKLNGTPLAEQSDAMNKVGSLGTPQTSALLAGFLSNNQDLKIQRNALHALANSGDGQGKLYEMMTTGNISKELMNTAALRLMSSWNFEIRNYAKTTLEEGNQLLAPIYQLTSKQGDITRGKQTFGLFCANCHQVDGSGTNFGPGLSEIGTKLSARGIYESIVYPSRGISFGYEGIDLELNDGTQLQGYVESETADGLELRMMGGILKTIPLSEIKSREEMEISLMPEGLPAAMGQDKLVDLVEYLKTLKSSS